MKVLITKFLLIITACFQLLGSTVSVQAMKRDAAQAGMQEPSAKRQKMPPILLMNLGLKLKIWAY